MKITTFFISTVVAFSIATCANAIKIEKTDTVSEVNFLSLHPTANKSFLIASTTNNNSEPPYCETCKKESNVDGQCEDLNSEDGDFDEIDNFYDSLMLDSNCNIL